MLNIIVVVLGLDTSSVRKPSAHLVHIIYGESEWDSLRPIRTEQDDPDDESMESECGSRYRVRF